MNADGVHAAFARAVDKVKTIDGPGPAPCDCNPDVGFHVDDHGIGHLTYAHDEWCALLRLRR